MKARNQLYFWIGDSVGAVVLVALGFAFLILGYALNYNPPAENMIVTMPRPVIYDSMHRYNEFLAKEGDRGPYIQ